MAMLAAGRCVVLKLVLVCIVGGLVCFGLGVLTGLEVASTESADDFEAGVQACGVTVKERIRDAFTPERLSETVNTQAPSAEPPPPPLEVTFSPRGARKFALGGCTLAYEVTVGSTTGRTLSIKAFALDKDGGILDSDLGFDKLSPGSLVEYNFSSVDCARIASVRWQLD